MTIIYCYPSFHSTGGIERIISLKANYLVNHGHKVIILTTDQQGRQPAYPLDKRVELHDMGIDYTRDWNQPILRKIQYLFTKPRLHKRLLDKFVKETEPDVIVSLFRNETTVIPKIDTTAKKVIEFHFAYQYLKLQYRQGIKGLLDKIRIKKMLAALKKYERLVILTNEDAKNWTKYNNFEVIPNFCTDRPAQSAPLNNKKVIAVGYYIPIKGFERLIDAWALVNRQKPDWTLHLVGEGNLREQLQAKINSLGLNESVFLAGHSDNMPQVYADSSILAVSSLSEGFPMAVIEAMTAGVPIVSYDCPCGPGEIINDGIDGFLVEDGNSGQFADRLIRLMEDDALRKKMGANAFENSKRFSQESIMTSWIRLFESL